MANYFLLIATLKNMHRKSFITLITICCLAGCASYPKLSLYSSDVAGSAGTLISVAPIKSYSKLTLRFLFWTQGLNQSLPVSNGIHLYRVVYWTTAPSGELTRASGLLGLPKSKPPYTATVSWQHGTASLRGDAPSALNVFHGLLPAAVFAGHGFVLLAPDYIGFGESNEPHSYYHRESTAAAVNDFIQAVESIFQLQALPWPEDVFLTGFSQGGYASLAAARANEMSEQHNIVAVAPIAAAVDLADTGFNGAITGASRFGSLYIAWIGASYARDYGLDLRTVFKPPWPSRLATLFDGEHSGDEIIATLPADPKDMLTAGALAAFATQSDHPFIELLKQNELIDWQPDTPICVFFGDADVDVTPKQAELLKAMNPDLVRSVSVGDVAHDPSILAAAPRVRAWLDGQDFSECPDYRRQR